MVERLALISQSSRALYLIINIHPSFNRIEFQRYRLFWQTSGKFLDSRMCRKIYNFHFLFSRNRENNYYL